MELEPVEFINMIRHISTSCVNLSSSRFWDLIYELLHKNVSSSSYGELKVEFYEVSASFLEACRVQLTRSLK